VNHITPLNLNNFNDGEKGSIRRCFKNKNEKGMYWDEEILIDEKNKRRRLSIYNKHNFSINGPELVTEQLYQKNDSKCMLSFTVSFPDNNHGWIDALKLHFASYTISNIFEGNLNRIKEIVENSY